MAEKKPQTLANHLRFVPLYHFLLALMLLANLGWSGWQLWRDFSAAGVMALITALALILLFYFARAFPLHVQDRLIRLEERLRLSSVLPAELGARVGELTPDQLIGLRFAPDEELEELVPRALDGELDGRQAIKKAIKSWRPDYYRC